MSKRDQIKFKQITILVLFICTLCLIGGLTQARQFRILQPIATPINQVVDLPVGAIPVEQPQLITREEAEPYVQQVIEKWNTNQMAETLSDEFYDKSRFMDVMDTVVPREAKLRIQSVQGVQTLQQYIMPNPTGERGDQVSIVSVAVRTQLEFNSPTAGFVSLPGTNEYILEITTTAPP